MRSFIVLSRFSLLLATLLTSAAACPVAWGQLTVLSRGDSTAAWRSAQVASLSEQLSQKSLPEDLRAELSAQKRWLEAWVPGELKDGPLWETPEGVPAPVTEPVIDPEKLAGDLRARLLGPKAKPQVADTKALEQLLKEYPNDLGVRQLHLHWLDQRQYRKTYPAEIADAALKLAAMLELAKPQEDGYSLARSYALYRRVRALAYRELPEVVEKQPIADPKKFEAELVGAYAQLKAVAGSRPEYILIDVRMLRRDGQFGRALEILTDQGSYIERQWFLKKQRDLLRELGWSLPAKEAATVYAAAFPEEAKAEEEGKPSSDALD